jgi:hypothetical protein
MPNLDENHPFVKAFSRQQKAFVDAIFSYGDCNVYAEKISKWKSSNVFSTFIDVATPMRCGFMALAHGDAWINNMMFKLNEDPIDVLMYDYQGSTWASPSSDILYFLLSSVNDDIKVDYFDDFIEFYHQELSEALKKLAYDQHIPTLSELFIDIMEKGHFGKIIFIFINSHHH